MTDIVKKRLSQFWTGFNGVFDISGDAVKLVKGARYHIAATPRRLDAETVEREWSEIMGAYYFAPSDPPARVGPHGFHGDWSRVCEDMVRVIARVDAASTELRPITTGAVRQAYADYMRLCHTND
jgi:hypothetical protein